MWTEISPRPRDFCGHPPCPRCYCWSDGEREIKVSGMAKMALDLLAKDISTATPAERKQLKAVADRIHNEGLVVATVPAKNSPPPDAVADLGMSDMTHINGWLRERRQEKPKAPRQLTCDEVYDRQNAREAEEARKTKERNERLKEAREIAKVFADAQPRSNGDSRDMEELRRAGVDPGFIRYMNERGVYNASEIYDRAQREGAMRPRASMFDPSDKIGPNSLYRY